uniref:CSON004835 protein n=1 Tax=Culicoides sonorensis TaxID=179676 RepID=A0A336L648_CULSO
MLDKILAENDYVVVFFYRDGDKKAHKILNELENIDDECEEKDISFVKTSDDGIDDEYDIASLPALAFYRFKIRTLYTGDLMNEDQILQWVLDLYESKLDVIESVDRKTLQVLIRDNDHLAVLFYSDEDCDECDQVLEELETIDDDTDKHGILFVKSDDEKLAHDIGIFSFPSLVYYETSVPIMFDDNKCFNLGLEDDDDKNDNNLSYQCCPKPADKDTTLSVVNRKRIINKDGSCFFFPKEEKAPPKPKKQIATKKDDTKTKTKGSASKKVTKKGNLSTADEVLQWIIEQKTDESIDEVDRAELLELIDSQDFLAIVFYDENDPKSSIILRHIELIDDEASEYGIMIVKCTDKLMAKKYGYRDLPGLSYFRKGKLINYDGEIDDEEELLDWLTNPDNMQLTDRIESVNKRMFQKIRQTSDYVAVFFYSDDCKQCATVLTEIEHIDDEADASGINFVKIHDKDMAKEFGVFALPAIVFFKTGSKEPLIYAGDLYEEEAILNWLLTQRNPAGDFIEDLEGAKLRNLIETSPSIAVYFYTDDCEQCAGILEKLENIDDDCDRHKITFVKTQDFLVAEQYGVTDFPVMVYFEDNVPNVYDGPLSEEEEVLQWLIQQKTEERIELITRVMLESMVDETQYLAVYFYKPTCNICDQILDRLEQIDDECDVFGIHMVKIQDLQLAKRYSIKTFPGLVYFRNGNPLLFEGDMNNEQSVLEWLIDDSNRELADEIEEVNDHEQDQEESAIVLKNLENIDGETDNLDITFVKMSDARYARKWGVSKLPALVYFRKRFPSIYRGDLHSEEDVLEWLRKNRFRQPELNIFMYIIIAIAIGFVIYTAFLLRCFKVPPTPPAIQPAK